MHTFPLQSVDSRYASSDQLHDLQFPIDTWPLPLMEHQAHTLRALRDPAYAVVLNTAMTGDGKSLAGPTAAAAGSALHLHPVERSEFRLNVQGLPERHSTTNWQDAGWQSSSFLVTKHPMKCAACATWASA